jgi:hypothetical protein
MDITTMFPAFQITHLNFIDVFFIYEGSNKVRQVCNQKYSESLYSE